MHISWASFSGINQSAPIYDSNTNTNNAANVTFGSQIDYMRDGVTFYVAGNLTGGLTMTPPAGFTQQIGTTNNGHSSFVANITTIPHAASGNYVTGTAVAFPGGGARSSLIVASLRPWITATTAGSATATASGATNINVSMPYTNDDDADNTYTVEYCLTSANCSVSGSWITWISGAAHTASPYATTILGLTSGTSYDVRVTYIDADGVTGTNPQIITAVTPTVPTCGTSYTYSAPAGTNRVVVVVVSAEGVASPTNVQVGGTNATGIATVTNGNARIYTGYRVIGTSAVPQLMNITATNGDCFYATTYQNINQTAGNGASNTINSIATGTAASGTTTTSTNVFNAAGGVVTNSAGGRVLYAINMNNGTADNLVSTGTSTAWSFTELFDKFEGGQNRTAVGESTTTAAGSAAVSVGDGGVAHNRSVLVAFALNSTNTAPTVSTPIADVNVLEDAANTVFSLYPNFADTENTDAQLTYSVTGNTNPGLFTSVNITDPTNFTLDFAPNANGTSNITVRATDTGGLFVEDTFTVTATAVNDAPSFTMGANQTVNEDAGAQSVANWAASISAGPTDEAGQSLTFTVTNNNNALFNVQPSIAANGTLTYTPATNANGSATVTVVSLQDNGGTTNGGLDTFTPASNTFTITVNPVNDAPVCNDVSITTNEDTTGTTPPNCTDADGDTLTYNAVDSATNGTGSFADPNLTYTPDADFNGSDSFTYSANDGTVNSNNATVNVTVNAVNDAPVCSNVSITTNEDTTGTTLPNCNDVDGDNLTYNVVDSAISGAGSFVDPNLTYIPDANFNGSDSFTYSANDGTVDSNSAMVNVTVNAVNDAPVCNNVSIITSEDTTGTTLPNCSDVDGDTLTYSAVNTATNGAGSFIDPDLTYVPNANFNGTDSFTYSANDGTVDSNSATVYVTVNTVNDSPTVTTPITDVNVLEDAANTVFSLYPNFGDVEDSDIQLTYSVAGNTNPGLFTSVNIIDPTSFTLDFALNANGTADITVRATDTGGAFIEDTFSVTVSPVNDVPVCSNVSITTNEDITGTTLPNCNDVDGDTLTYNAVDSAANGTGSFVDPNLTYIPDANFNGTDNFTYFANDGTVNSNSATVNVTISAVNDAPVCSTVSITTNEDTTGTILPNCTDTEGDTLTYSAVDNAANGTGSFADPNLTYIPDANFNGTDSFTYTANDGTNNSNVATVNVTVNAVNDAPVCNNVSIITNEDTTGTTLPNCTDVDGDTLTYIAVDSATSGTGSFVNPNLTYMPDLNFNGSDSFTYYANDGTVNSNSATVNVTVNAVNDAPVCNNVSITTNEDTTGTTLPNCMDVEGDPLTYSAIDSAANGTGSFVNPNLTYVPDANFNGSDSFTYIANDGTSNSNTATVNVTVNAANDAPVCNNVSITTNEDTTGTTLPNCNDVDGDTLTYSVVNNATNGSGSFIDPNLTYVPDANFNGADNFTYFANDGTVNSNSATVNVTVSAINDAPVCNDVSITTSEDTAGMTTPDCTDTEGDTLTYNAVNSATNGTGSFIDPNLTYIPNANFNGTDSFTYTANDGTSNSNSATVNVTVNGVNDPPTVSAPIADVNVLEDAANTVFNLYPNFADLEDADPQLTYLVVGNTNPGLFTSVNIADPANFTLDYTPETSGIADITIRATDTGGLFVEDTFQVTVTIVDDTPTNIDLSNDNVNENQPSGTLIGTLTTFDVDSSIFTYSLVLDAACPGATASDNGAFQIGGVSGDELQTATSLDFETQNSYTICIQTDDGNSTFAEEFTITVNDLDDTAPYVVSSVRADADPTSAVSVNFTVTFSENVTGVDISDFSLTTAGTVAGSVSSVSGGGTTWTVTVNSVSGDGTLRLDVSDNDTIIDGSSNPLGGAGIGNGDFTTGEFYTIDQTGPNTTILTQPSNPSNVTDATFTYDSPEVGATFECSMDGSAFAACPANYTGLSAGSHTFQVRAVDALGNVDSSPASYTWIIDLGFPTMSTSTPANNKTVATGPTQLIVHFSEDVKNDGSAGAANSVANYLLVENGTNATFETLSCAGGVVLDDAQITVDSVSYTNNGGSGPFVATLNINGGVALPVGKYRLFVCGTTSIEDLAGNELNNGLSDALVNFTVARSGGGSTTITSGFLPATGFPMNTVTQLPAQPVDLAYASTDLWLEIPRLGVKMTIVGVPLKDGKWDVTWLDQNAGWLNGSAYPTWNGNSVLTGHVWDALNRPGPFAELKKLKYGDQIKIHAFGQVYIYEVRENEAVTPTDTSSVFQHEEKPWLTLVTCEDYREASQTYSSRRMVRAVLVNVVPEK